MRNRFFLALLLFISSCQMALGQNSTIGREFWVGFMENYGLDEGAYSDAVLIITANEKTSGVIEYLGRSSSFDLNKGQQYELRINSGNLNLMHRTSGKVENKGIFIKATGNIAVHAFNEMFRTTDGTVVLPVGGLGKDYYITTHQEVSPFPSTLLVVATEDNTKIEITTSVNSVSGNRAGVPSIIVLNRGQSYQIKADKDLTGSRVRIVDDIENACRKIAVFGGSVCTWVGDCEGCDNLFQQSYPVSSWGKHFVHIALKERTSGELVKVLASEDDTKVGLNGIPQGTINKGQFLTIDFRADESGKIETSKPSSVTVFSRGVGCNDNNIPGLSGIGDPFMITYSPIEQFLKDLVFNSFQLANISNHYVNIVVKAGTQHKTALDGDNVGKFFEPLSGDTDFQIARIRVSGGAHHLTNPDGFAAYVYGFGFRESYGYAAGAALGNLEIDIQSAYEFEVNGDQVACLDQEGEWSISTSTSGFTYFVWDFGDGSPSHTGQHASHTFTRPGKYMISVTASTGSCEDGDEATFEVEVMDPKAELVGQTTVCPYIEEVMYRLVDKQDITETEFEAIGGEILESYVDSVLVRWGPSNPDAKLIMTPYAENGCPGRPVELEVKIESDLQALRPIVPVEVCFEPELAHTYSVEAHVQGRAYEWTVTGGKLVSGQGSQEIQVIWDQPGIQAGISYTVYGTENHSCVGISPEITIQVAEPLANAQVTHVACAGESSGTIELTLLGEHNLYTYEWQHDPSLNGPIAENLSAGFYSVTIRNQKGCSQVIKAMEVSETVPMIRMPTGFDPRQAPGIYEGVSDCKVSFELWIYDRWGALFYYGDTGWDGSINGKEAPIGSYFYIVNYHYTLDKKTQREEKKGTFVLVR
ncbi:PKD domain-containing protein [Lunatibacter salilacus]|uniref:PKD domain-containing protein n=1 Tax=Lunatibacter salilacus TaxID=2483804 RepID=UPI00131DFEC9|nr:PKD domain-containing protein [Lunatibacter salilacus]